jgi:hypothetical protein
VTFSRAKPVDRLYEEVAGCDVVVVSDLPLAGAINRRQREPRLGVFAGTPRRLVDEHRETAEGRTAFLDVVGQLDRPWPRIGYEVGNVLQCWEHRSSADAIFEYESYVSEATRAVVDGLDRSEVASARLEAFQIDDDLDVAVVGETQLTPLERSILPEEYAAVDPFTDEAFDRPPFRILPSKTAVVETVVDAVDAGTAGDVAVVLDEASAYSPLLEAALEAAEIPFYGGPGFADDPDHRAFLSLLRLVRAGSETRVRAARPLLARVGDPPPRGHDERRLGAADGDAVSWLRGVRARAETHTFESLLGAFERRVGRRLDAFRDELAALGIADARVTDEAVDRLAFYLRTYEVPVDRENEGVLLADATSAAHVDRPTVFHLGLGEGWTPAPPTRPWVDRERAFERGLRDFQLLLQSGRRRYYLVTDAEGGAPVTPAPYLRALLEGSVERFSDRDHVEYGHHGASGGDGFDREPVDAAVETVETVSQTDLATYVNSPRDYLFSRLLDTPDRDYLLEGRLFHEFAEFCVADPSFVDDGVLDEAVGLVLDETRPLLRGVDEPVRRTEYRVALETIRRYVTERDPDGDPSLDGREPRREGNAFAAHFDRRIDVAHAERWFDEPALGLRGKIDLIAAPTRLVDHKSGARASAASVVRDSALDPPSDTPDFQAATYLSYWRSRHPDTAHEFAFFHFLECLDEAVAEGVGLDGTLTTVGYHPTSFAEHVRSRAVFESLRDDGAGDCRKTLGRAEYADWRAAFAVAEPPPTAESDALIDSAFGTALIDRMRTVVGEYRYVTSGCEQALRELGRIYGRNYFAGDLDAFEAFVDERLDGLNAGRTGEVRFPVAGPGGEPTDRRLNHPDLLLEGSR